MPHPTPTDKSAEALPELPESLEIDWPELHSQALGCGVEDRNLHNRYECAEYGWQEGVDSAASRVPDQIYDADQMRTYARAAILADRTARAASPVQSVDEDRRFTDLLSELICAHRFEKSHSEAHTNFIAHIDSLLAARPSAAPSFMRGTTEMTINGMPTAAPWMVICAPGFTYEIEPAAPHDRQAMTHAEMLALVATHSQAEPVSPVGAVWTCFHCNESFSDEDSARLHFGKSERLEPACKIDIAKYREMEKLAQSYADDDSEMHRQMYAMESRHAQALRREEEKGYARALKDTGYTGPATPPAVTAPDMSDEQLDEIWAEVLMRKPLPQPAYRAFARAIRAQPKGEAQ